MIELDTSKIELLAPDSLQNNPWNPNSVGAENMEKLVESIRVTGFFKPVLVRELEEDTLQILGGQHRADAARQLGINVPVLNLGVMSDEEAKKITLIDNDGYGENDSALLSKVLRDLVDSGEDILSQMTYSESELSNMLDLTTTVDFDSLDSLGDIDSDMEPPVETSKIEDDQDDFKTFRLKISIADVEEFEDLIRDLTENFGLEDSDPAVIRGLAFLEMGRAK